MKYAAVANGDITENQLSVFRSVLLQITQNRGLDGIPSCHELCAFLANTYRMLEHRSGYFAQHGVEHSWLRFKGMPEVVIDAYPVAGAVPFIVTTEGSLNPWRKLYIDLGWGNVYQCPSVRGRPSTGEEPI
jgi:hypothetical protein